MPEGALPVVDSEHAEQWDSGAVVCDLVVLNPTGLFFNRCPQDELPPADKILPGERTTHRGGTWHWPRRVEDGGC